MARHRRTAPGAEPMSPDDSTGVQYVPSPMAKLTTAVSEGPDQVPLNDRQRRKPGRAVNASEVTDPEAARCRVSIEKDSTTADRLAFVVLSSIRNLKRRAPGSEREPNPGG